MRRGATLDPRTARCLEIPLVSLMRSVATLDPRTARAAARLLLRLLGAGYSDYLATSATHPLVSEERYLLLTRV